MSYKLPAHIYFVGIGGIGMSALARWCKANGILVAGYDKTPTQLTQELEQENIPIHYEDNIQLIPKNFKNKETTKVVFTPAIPADHSELLWFKKNGFDVMKRSQLLGLITANHFTIAVAGTHGKTTTSSMIAHLLHQAGVPVTALIGGIMQNYGTNALISDAENAVFVVEADEYDRSFLTLNPDIAIVTSTDADHLDIYENHQNLTDSFEQFIQKIKPNGKLIIKEKLNLKLPTNHNIQVEKFGINSSENTAKNIQIKNGIFYFDVEFISKKVLKNIALQVPGFHNVENLLSAIIAVKELIKSDEKLIDCIESYKGVKRRFEYIVKNEKNIYIDDYAHHPEEIKSFLKSVRFLYPEQEITAIFQPHLYSRTRDFADGFAESLEIADKIILLDIYPAREKPIQGVTSDIIFDKIKKNNKTLCNKNNLMSILVKQTITPIITTIGAGDIDLFVPAIQQLLTEKN